MASEGKFIVLEGIDGSGTTTHARFLCQRLLNNGHQAIWTNEPSGGPIGTELRALFRGQRGVVPPDKALALIFMADRIAHVEQVIKPALEKGVVVICDRYQMSTFVYQRGVWPKDDLDALYEPCCRPDLTILLRIPMLVAKRRRFQRFAEIQKFQEEMRGTEATWAGSPAADVFEGDEVQLRVTGDYEMEARHMQDLGEEIAAVDSSGETAETHEKIWEVARKVLGMESKKEAQDAYPR